jgi:hypothetical protein
VPTRRLPSADSAGTARRTTPQARQQAGLQEGAVSLRRRHAPAPVRRSPGFQHGTERPSRLRVSLVPFYVFVVRSGSQHV